MQVKEEADSIASVSGLDIRVSALTATGIAAQRDQFLHIGQIVVSTPGRIAQVCARPHPNNLNQPFRSSAS